MLNDTLVPGRLYVTQHKIFFHSQNFYSDDEIRVNKPYFLTVKS
jgi:hypothetical protein